MGVMGVLGEAEGERRAEGWHCNPLSEQEMTTRGEGKRREEEGISSLPTPQL